MLVLSAHGNDRSIIRVATVLLLPGLSLGRVVHRAETDPRR